MKQKLLASAMALAMVLSLTPVTALAADGEDTTLPEEEITVQTETPVEEPVQPETETEDAPAEEIPEAEIEEPTELDPPVETSTLPEIPVEDPMEIDVIPEDNTVPEIADMTVSIGDTIYSTEDSGNIVVIAPSDSQLSDFTVSLTISDDAVLTPTAPEPGDLYVVSSTNTAATLQFNLSLEHVDLDDSAYALSLTSTDGTTWNGNFSYDTILTADIMAGFLEDQDIQLAENALGNGSAARTILVNRDDTRVMAILCAADADTYTVNYVVDSDTTITWELPAGIAMPLPEPTLSANETLEGWYTDEDRTVALSDNATVTGNTTLYAKISDASDKTFVDKLLAHEDVTISSMDDWNAFVANSSSVVSGQLVTLGTNINCNGATYTTLTFKGNFDGGNFTISNASFNSAAGRYYTSTEDDIVCSGLFNSIGPGQIIANLKLDNITAKSSTTYAGVLAGLVDGTSSNRALIQNIQVTNSSATGRTAAGVVGFVRNADVKFCSSRNCTITGVANGGGIVGINNSVVSYCYSTCTPTAFPSFLGGSTGGVVSKKVRGGYAQYCWSTMTVVGASDSGGTDVGLLEVSNATTEDDFVEAGYNAEGAEYWELGEGTTTDFNASVDYTAFPANPNET